MSAEDVASRAASAGKNSQSMIATSIPDMYRLHSSGKYNVPISSLKVQSRWRNTIVVDPITTVSSSSFLDGGQLDFHIPKNGLSIADDLAVKINITNATGAACVLAPIQSCVDELDFNGTGDNPLTRRTGQELMLMNLVMDRDEFEQKRVLMGYADNNYSTAGDSIANAATVDRYIFVNGFFHVIRPHLPALNDTLKIHLKMCPSTLNLVSGSHPTVNSVQLIIRGYREPKAIRDIRRSWYHNKLPLHKPFLNPQRHHVIQVLQTSTLYSFDTKFRGVAAAILFTVRNSTETSTEQNNYRAIDKYNIKLSSDTSLLGSYTSTNNDNKIECAVALNNTYRANKNFYLISFSEDLISDIYTGSNHGVQAFDGTEKLEITTDASSITAGNSYRIDMYFLSREYVEINRGQVRTMS
jgi:hypothetical protein